MDIDVCGWVELLSVTAELGKIKRGHIGSRIVIAKSPGYVERSLWQTAVHKIVDLHYLIDTFTTLVKRGWVLQMMLSILDYLFEKTFIAICAARHSYSRLNI